MADIFDITRRTFLRNSALLTAGTALAQTAELPQPTPSTPVFPYGAVYFRKTDPPEADWARDHETAARTGMNIFRHWFMWSAIEVAPGKYDWSDYDRMMDLAAKNGIKVVVEELVGCAPEWAFRKYPHARYLGSDDFSSSTVPCPRAAQREVPWPMSRQPGGTSPRSDFPRRPVEERYRNHPALFGYDLWNEGTSFGEIPTGCTATAKARNENFASGCAFAMDRWRKLRSNGTVIVTSPGRCRTAPGLFPVIPTVSIGFNFVSITRTAYSTGGSSCSASSIPATRLQRTGSPAPSSAWLPHRTTNGVQQRKSISGSDLDRLQAGDEPWKQFQAVDLVRAGARVSPSGMRKPRVVRFRMQPQVYRPAHRGLGVYLTRKTCVFWNLVSCAAGAKGLLFCRWRFLCSTDLIWSLRAHLPWMVRPHRDRRWLAASRAGQTVTPDLEIESGLKVTSAWYLFPSLSSSTMFSKAILTFTRNRARRLPGFFRLEHSAGLCSTRQYR